MIWTGEWCTTEGKQYKNGEIRTKKKVRARGMNGRTREIERMRCGDWVKSFQKARKVIHEMKRGVK